ncbi:MAG TPA: protein YgfX [Usitatibacter sp.]|nr:protein YgfX [Usitatibacter sp.]
MHEVYCEFKYSGAAFALLAVAVGASLGLVVFVPFPDAVRALAFAWVVAMAWHAHRGLAGVQALRLDCNRGIAVRDRFGWRSGELCDGSFVAPWLTVIRWRPDGAHLDRTLVILPDMIQDTAMRRIRVILRWA